MNDSCLKGDEAETALCPCGIICAGLIAHGAVGVGKVIAHRRNDKAVFDLHRSDLDRRKHVLEFHPVTSLLAKHLVKQNLVIDRKAGSPLKKTSGFPDDPYMPFRHVC